MVNKLLSIKDVAEQLGVSELTIRRMIKSEKITVGKVGSQWRFYQSDVDAYVESMRPDRDTRDNMDTEG